MGIEIPEEYGGQGGTFFQAVLAVEEMAAVDPSPRVIVDVQNTLVINAHPALGNAGAEAQVSAAAREGHCRRRTRFRKRRSGSDAFALQTRAVPDGDGLHPDRPQAWITNAAEAGLFLVFANANPEAGYKESPVSSSSGTTPAFRSARKKTSSASAPPPPAS